MLAPKIYQFLIVLGIWIYQFLIVLGIWNYQFLIFIALPNLLKYKRAGKDAYPTIILVILSVLHQTEKGYNCFGS